MFTIDNQLMAILHINVYMMLLYKIRWLLIVNLNAKLRYTDFYKVKIGE